MPTSRVTRSVGVEVDREKPAAKRVDEVGDRGRHAQPVDDLHRAGQCGQPSQADTGHGRQYPEHDREDQQGCRGGHQERPGGPIPAPFAQVPHPHPHQKRQRDSGGGFDRDRHRDQDDAQDVTALEGQRDPGGHQAHHQHLVVHPAHQVDEHQRVEHADPQRERAVGAQMMGHPGRGPDQQRQSGQHAQAQQHGPRDHVVADDHRDELRNQDERRAIGCRGDGPNRTYVVQQRVRVSYRTDRIGIEPVAQEGALGQIRVGITAEDGHRQQQRRQPETRWWPAW